MKKVVSYLLVLAVSFLVAGNVGQAAMTITNVSIFGIANNSAMLHWRTPNEWTRAIIYYGLQSDNLDKNIIYVAYHEDHETALTGLEVDKTYYYRILAINQANQTTQNFIQSFSTKDMKSTVKPSFEVAELVQALSDAVLIKWETNKETKATIRYGKDQDNLNQNTGYGALDKNHYLFFDGLEPNNRYHVQIEAEDRDGNKELSRGIVFNTSINPTTKPDLQINNIEPQNYNPELIFNDRAVIKWQTNYAARGTVYYGTLPDRLDKSVNTTDYYPVTAQRVVLAELKAQTIYYYKIKAHTSFYNKETETKVMSFSTGKEAAPAVNVLDSDGDTLSDEYELQIGTDPFKSDSDSDGYPDGTEVRNGYNPLGLGKARGAGFKYNQMRLPLGLEQKLALELKHELQKKIGQLKIASKDWSNFVNAYVYGNYPIEVLTKAAVKYSNQLISTTQPWDTWRENATYKNYIDKK